MNESQNSFESEIVSKSKELLETSNPDLTILQFTKSILWEKAIISNGVKGEILEVPLVLLDHIGTMNNDPETLKDFHRLLFMKDDKNNLKVYHLQVITNPKSFDNLSAEFNFYSINANFDGLITLTDSNKQTVDYLRFEDGEKVKPSKASKEAAVTCIYFGWWYETGSFRPISLVSCSTGGGDGNTGYGYQGGGRGGPTKSNAQSIEDKIDYSSLDSCPKEIMELLKKATNNDISKILTILGASDIYTVNMVMKPADTYAETQRISKYNYEIRVDRDRYTGGTKLFKATAFIHEIIHAYFLSIVDDYNYTPSTALPSFPELFEAFVIKEHPTSIDKQDAQHLAMANKYVDAMASALQEYDANYMIDYQVYQDMAWGSLRDAPIFEKKFPLGSANNIRITNRYKAESSGHAVDQGTPNQQIPVGKICK